jgi:hypothetical protein
MLNVQSRVLRCPLPTLPKAQSLMNKDLQTLLQLDGLVLTRKGLELTGNPIRKGGLDDLDKEIEKLCRHLPPAVVSRYELLARKYADPLSMLTGTFVMDASGRFPNESRCWPVVRMKFWSASIAAGLFSLGQVP